MHEQCFQYCIIVFTAYFEHAFTYWQRMWGRVGVRNESFPLVKPGVRLQ